MKEYCVDLKIAKELKENGFPQNCKFFYAKYNKKIVSSEQWGLIISPFDSQTIQKPYLYAPTTDEILTALPNNFISDGNHYWLYII